MTISNIQLRRVLSAQPLTRMRYLAAQLGWRGLQLEYVPFSDDEAGPTNFPDDVVIYYMTTDRKFNLQINTYPHGQIRFHRGTVSAYRYGIVHVGWHDFELHEDDHKMEREIQRLRSALCRSHFKDPKWRRRLAQEHPELPIRMAMRHKRR